MGISDGCGSSAFADRRWAIDDRWATLHAPSGQVIAFQGVDYVAPRWPDPAYSQQLHLDLHVNEMERAHARIDEQRAALIDTGCGPMPPFSVERWLQDEDGIDLGGTKRRYPFGQLMAAG